MVDYRSFMGAGALEGAVSGGCGRVCGILWMLLVLTTRMSTAHATGLSASGLSASDQLTIDQSVTEILAKTGVPSASIAIVKDGAVAYLKAYGQGHLDPSVPATPAMRYGIGSVSKQFVATAILMLAEDGKLDLDDPVGRYISGLTAGDKITIRQVLNHTSGYRDYWPQSFLPPEMRRPVTPDQILVRFARAPLDFEPGSKWQYSNTGYTIAGLIIERVSGQSLMSFLNERIFRPLGMSDVTEDDTRPLPESDAAGYTRFALGPPRRAPKEGAGWLFAAGPLAMRAQDLAVWDIGVIEHKLLKPESYKQQFTSAKLTSGEDTHYGLGVQVRTVVSRPVLKHSGGMAGFRSENRIYPEDKAAIVVLTNADFGVANRDLGDRLEGILFHDGSLDRARDLYAALVQRKVDRTWLTDHCNSYFTPQAMADYATSLAPLGKPDSFVRVQESLRGGFDQQSYRLTFHDRALEIETLLAPDGKFEQFMVLSTE